MEGWACYARKKWVGHGDGHKDGSPGKKVPDDDVDAAGAGAGAGRDGADGEAASASSGHIGSNLTHGPASQQASSWAQAQARVHSWGPGAVSS